MPEQLNAQYVTETKILYYKKSWYISHKNDTSGAINDRVAMRRNPLKQNGTHWINIIYVLT